MRSVCTAALAALLLGLTGCSAEAEGVHATTPITVESAHQLQRVDARGLFAVLEALRGKGLLVNIWRST